MHSSNSNKIYLFKLHKLPVILYLNTYLQHVFQEPLQMTRAFYITTGVSDRIFIVCCLCVGIVLRLCTYADFVSCRLLYLQTPWQKLAKQVGYLLDLYCLVPHFFSFYFFHPLSLPRLQVIADTLMEHFVSSGLMIKEWDRVKLHATVMNTLFRKDPNCRYLQNLPWNFVNYSCTSE